MLSIERSTPEASEMANYRLHGARAFIRMSLPNIEKVGINELLKGLERAH